MPTRSFPVFAGPLFLDSLANSLLYSIHIKHTDWRKARALDRRCPVIVKQNCMPSRHLFQENL